MSAIRLLPTVNTLASLAIDGPASATWNTVVEANPNNYPRADGNAITLAAAVGGTWVACAGTLTAAGNANDATKAELDLDTVTGDLDTIVQAKVGGTAGDAITVTVVGDSGAAEGVTIEEVGTAVTIHFEDGVSTVLDVETAIGTDSDLIEVKTTGTAATVLDAATDECTDEPLAGGAEETVTIGDTVYLFRDTTVIDAFDVLIGATASDTLDNLIAAINLTGTEGTTYGTGTTEHPTVRAFPGAGDTMIVHSRPEVLAAAGTLIASTEECAAMSWGATTLGNGTDGTNVTFVVTGTAIACTYAAGFSTVEDFEAAVAADEDVSALIRVKTAGTTPLYLLVVTDDDFSATNLTGGGATASGAPTLTSATAGVALPHATEQARLLLRTVDVATGTTKTVVGGKLWGFSPNTLRWYVHGTINAGSDLAETSTDAINYSENITGLRRWSRVYFQFTSLGGTGTEIEVVLDCIPSVVSN